jgi:hypothetical protein
MKQYCYVVMNNAGHSWIALGFSEAEGPKEQNSPALPQLLQEGWVPVRETPMGGGPSSLAHSLILLEKTAKPQKAAKKRGEAT